MSELLRVDDLVIRAAATGREVVRGVSFHLDAGESVALVGESGSGKSMTARAIVGLLPHGLTAHGRISLAGQNVLALNETQLRRVRGTSAALLLQDPFTMLNPLITAGKHVAETLRAHRGARSQPADVTRRLAEVGITRAGAAGLYPFELSGGMRQRVALAAALANDPRLLIADEPTTALDTTTQRAVLRLLHHIQRDSGMGLLLITHDLRVAFSLCDRVLVMRAGAIVETGDSVTVRTRPRHEYTIRLLAAEPPADHVRPDLAVTPRPASAARPLLTVRDLTKRFTGRDAPPALDGVSVELAAGRSLGVVGESGSGKTTLARCVLGLERPTSGTITLDGLDLTRHRRSRVSRLLGCVFQDPYSSLNPAHSVGFALAEAVRQRLPRDAVASAAARLLADVGLPANYAGRRPAALSGGERQRVAIARALALEPRVLVCDEPVAALDLSIQDQVLRVLRDVRARGVSLLFITHDLAVARQLTDDLVVLHRGRVVESGPTDRVLGDPRHDYTRQLIAAVPTGDRAWLS